MPVWLQPVMGIVVFLPVCQLFLQPRRLTPSRHHPTPPLPLARRRCASSRGRYRPSGGNSAATSSTACWSTMQRRQRQRQRATLKVGSKGGGAVGQE